MDALKGCTSNVHVLKDIDAIRYRLLVCEEPASSSGQHVANTIARLRSENVMCTATRNRIWIFEGAEEEEFDHLVKGFRLEATSTIAEHKQTTIADGPHVIPILLDALEGSISFVLSRAHNALRLSSWVWLLPAVELQDSSIEIHMQTKLTDDEKRLNVATAVRSSDLLSVSSKDFFDNLKVTIAPGGISATLLIEEGENVALPSSLGDDQWRASVRDALATEGLQVPYDASWLSVVPDGSQEAVRWPSSLCFAQVTSTTVDTLGGSFLADWRGWFDLSGVGNYDDPLSYAEEWTTTFAEREAQVYTHDTIRHEDSTMNDLSNIQAPSGNAAFDVSSPPLTNRPDLQALHGIYPTPPDGLLAHVVTQAQAQNENALNSNADAMHAPNYTPSDPAPDSIIPNLDGGADAEDEPLQRNLSIVSTIGPHPQEWHRGSSDDLFGDMDDMEYGREEVGDADFNFFDDADAEPATGIAEARHEPTVATAAEHTATPHKPTHDVAVSEPTHGSLPQVSTELSKTEMNAGNLTVTGQKISDSPDPPRDDHMDTRTEILHNDEPSSPSLSAKVQQIDDMKPLSPFGIKEALLPPPIPASVSQNHAGMPSERRRSSFGPLVFNSSSHLAPHPSFKDYSDFTSDGQKSSYELRPTRVPRAAASESSVSIDTPSSLEDADSESEAGTDAENDSSSTTSEQQRLTDVKLEASASVATRKRKRTPDTSSYCGPQPTLAQQGSHDQHPVSHGNSNTPSAEKAQDFIFRLLGKRDSSDVFTSRNQQSSEFECESSDLLEQGARVAGQLLSKDVKRPISVSPENIANVTDTALKSVKHIFPNLKSSDFVVLGQIVAEQAVAVARRIALGFAASFESPCSTLRNLDPDLESISLDFTLCDLSSLALVREPLQVQRTQPGQVNPNLASQARHPPRPPPRVDPTSIGPDIVPLAASFVRANRSESAWEMAPTALSFWEALGLSPVSGSKDIRHFCIAPNNPVLEDAVAEFLLSLKAAYEGCKFGSMAIDRETGGTSPYQDANNVHLVSIDSSMSPSIAMAMQAYWDACSALGRELAEIAFDEPARTLVVSMINPFPSTTSADWAVTSQYFGACFLNLSKAYRTAASRDKRFNGKGLAQRQMSDIDFKVVPIDLVASPSSLVVPTAQQMGLLAREMYDRCPPSSDAGNESSPLSIPAAPSVELVAPLPKRIGFSLTSEPPMDLLYEASVLHVAYAISPDFKWANVIWHDNTGRYANSCALCMQGRSFADIALEVWRRTLDLIKAREVIWRIFIVTAGNDGIEISRANCWKDIISQHMDRKQLLSVTLLHFQPDLALNITPPPDTQLPGSAAPTPAATPQPASGQGFSTTSPDAVSAGNAPGTAPPTPAPSEAASSILEADSEAHLVEVEDETWGMLIDRDLASILRTPESCSENSRTRPDQIAALSYGVLVKRGKSGNAASSSASERPFPCAGASLIWTLRVRSKNDRQGTGERPNVDEGSVRHCEVMLREVLGMFRNLGLLSKVKGLDPSGLIPVHIVAAMKGAEGLNGLLSEPTMEPGN